MLLGYNVPVAKRLITREMNRTEAQEKIGKALAVLTYQTRAESLAGFFSKNRLVEDLLLPIFRLVLKARHLHNLNQDVPNFPYIDLADDRSRLAIQVTTERSAAKVTETLTNFVSSGYQKRYKRLVYFVLDMNGTRFSVKSKRRWNKICRRKLHFDPAKDILTIHDLFRLIVGLEHSKFFAVHDIIAQSVIGEDHIDVKSLLTRQSERQLDYEKKSGKYIPGVFVETRETKNLARIFAHPTLFFGRTLGSLGRLNIRSWNRFLAKAGLPPLPFPNLAAISSTPELKDVGTTAVALSTELSGLSSLLVKYEKLSRNNPPPFKVEESRAYFYEENTFALQSSLGWGLNYQLKDLMKELAAAPAKVFILTGKAGQGKTNFVCDFVEKFLLKHRIPCVYISGRRLSLKRGTDLGEVIHKLLFEGKTQSFAEAASLLSGLANRGGKPFVLIIDGLNEHHDINLFAEQLEQFIEEVFQHSSLKLFLTCRSEFFQQRFGNLTKAPLAEHVLLVEANENRLDQEFHDEMLAGYFKFFEIQERLVSPQVLDTLKKDMLLLRFFCEAYGARGKPPEYRQERIGNIYRERIFEIYLQEKLGTAKAFLRRFTGKTSPIDEKADLIAVLEHCLVHMLQTWQFADVPVSAVPATLRDAFYALLDEELILRRDPPPSSSSFSPSTDAVNFTFDEFRDFLLAQYLVHRTYVTDRPSFEQYIARNDPKQSQIIEGLKRFLFYASRKEENTEFWEFYKNQAWYKDVYDREVFNIDTKLLRDEDGDIIKKALQANDDRAVEFARQLALNWHPLYYRLLNLDLLLSFVTESDNAHFDSLIMGGFRTI